MGSTNANPKPASGTTQNPYVLPSVENSPDLMEIRKPPPPPTWSTQPIALAMYSSNYAAGGGFASVNHSTNAWGGHRSGSNLDDFDPYDPSNYMDSGKATDDIKALLEGAFEDEDDKPRTRGKKKKIQEKTNELVDKMKSLGIETDKSLEDESIVEEEEEDDGTVEGMKVKLLPHQVDGIEWMRQKETGSKKIKGSLPKGGILADDVCCRHSDTGDI